MKSLSPVWEREAVAHDARPSRAPQGFEDYPFVSWESGRVVLEVKSVSSQAPHGGDDQCPGGGMPDWEHRRVMAEWITVWYRQPGKTPRLFERRVANDR